MSVTILDVPFSTRTPHRSAAPRWCRVRVPRQKRAGDLHPRPFRGLHQLDGFTPELRRVLRRTPHTGLLPLASRQNQVSTEAGQGQLGLYAQAVVSMGEAAAEAMAARFLPPAR